MTTHFTSDNHFGHRNILKYSNRPFLVGEDLETWQKASLDKKLSNEFRPSDESVANMNKEMIRLWNEQVKSGDTVYLNGDFAFFKTKEQIIEVLEQLNGEKHFNFGNHDQTIMKFKSDFLHPKRFASMRDYRVIKVEGERIVMLHYGMRVWDRSHHGVWHLFGHSHNSLPPQGKSVDVGVDSTPILGFAPYRPFSMAELKTFMDKQAIVNLDHHDNETQ